ncbi:uncharacterized protein LOC128987680 [Macrosteles quadrilineatus]|uniref:uncharacterized protein LOC128987680 n=1 Tax=Macrosteles quadrilineatus TaxID=74068 RepID=UPI0023E20753|nr:uncharacterized protein LOC128987680 [Macrosteles quadrilineatus]
MEGKELPRRKPRRWGPRQRTEVRRSSGTQIPVAEVATLFRCGKCLVAPIKPPVFTCRNGHLNCANCYHALNRDCYKCKEPLLGRNHVLEDVMRSLPIETCSALSDCNVSLRESRSEQSLRLSLQDPELLEKLELARKEAEVQDKKKFETKKSPESRYLHLTELGSSSTSCSSTASLNSLQIRSSSRPITCPFPCDRIVTCSGLVPHFEFYHPQVLLHSKVNKNCDVEVKISYDDVKLTDEDEGRCIIFFVVKLADNGDEEDDLSKSADLLRVARNSQEMVRRGYFVALLSAGLLPSGLGDSRVLAVWVSALYDFAPVTYTLRVSDVEGTHSFSFQGLPSSLHKDQRPKEVYQRGDCLTVPAALLHDFHSAGQNLDLTVAFHSDLPFPFVPTSSRAPWVPDTQGLIL